MRALKKIQCPLCRGKGGFWDTLDRKPPLGIWEEPPEFFWDECPECEGTGTTWEEVWEEPDPWEEIFQKEDRIPLLSQWVQAYREARHRARLPPHEAKTAADLATYGPPDLELFREGESLEEPNRQQEPLEASA